MEVAGIALLTALLTCLSLFDVLWPPATAWLWLAFGIGGTLAFIVISLRDSAFMLPIIASVCYERLDHRQLHLLDVRDDIAQGLHYHKLLFEEIAHQHAPGLGLIVHDLDRLLIAMMRMAQALDQFVADDYIREYLQSLMPGNTAQRGDTFAQYTALFSFAQADLSGALTVQDDAAAQHELLRRVYNSLMRARADLQDAIAQMAAAHWKVAGLTREDRDLAFMRDLKSQISGKAQRIESHVISIETLRRHCEAAAAVQAQ
jgi:hypothetical protein